MVFVAMPFGRKQDPSGTIEIDFDDVYVRGIIPVTEDADVDVIRADEERMGGFIHAPMYERLLLAEIVIADLTLANPNVFYELGIRHAARPRATIMIFNEGGTLPFDVRPMRAIPYRLNENGRLSDEEAKRLGKTLAAKLREAQKDDISDSPLFQLIPSFPGIQLPHEVTESFRDRVKYIDAIRGGNIMKLKGKLIATRGSSDYLFDVGNNQGRIFDIERGIISTPFNLNSILTRGFWDEYDENEEGERDINALAKGAKEMDWEGKFTGEVVD